jgi:hypothetical protein
MDQGPSRTVRSPELALLGSSGPGTLSWRLQNREGGAGVLTTESNGSGAVRKRPVTRLNGGEWAELNGGVLQAWRK